MMIPLNKLWLHVFNGPWCHSLTHCVSFLFTGEQTCLIISMYYISYWMCTWLCFALVSLGYVNSLLWIHLTSFSVCETNMCEIRIKSNSTKTQHNKTKHKLCEWILGYTISSAVFSKTKHPCKSLVAELAVCRYLDRVKFYMKKKTPQKLYYHDVWWLLY